MNKNDNCFNLIRHLAAFAVLFSHNFPLSGRAEPVFRGWETIGFISVVVFFSLSGFLMPKSFASSGNFMIFMIKRLRRLTPGLLVCSFIMIFIINPIFTTGDIFSGKFIKDSLLLFIQHSAFIFNDPKNLFNDFIVPNAMNGSLWTLPIEFLCYILIGSALSLVNSFKPLILLIFTCIVISVTMRFNGYIFYFFGVPIQSLLTFGIAFFTGAILSMTLESWIKFKNILITVAIIAFISTKNGLEMSSIGVLCISILTIAIGLTFKSEASNKIDISYGIYIYAFPVQQIAINTISSDFTISLIISFIITTLIAFLSYKYVEEPFLKGKWLIGGRI